jgi:hypothetical protein
MNGLAVPAVCTTRIGSNIVRPLGGEVHVNNI